MTEAAQSRTATITEAPGSYSRDTTTTRAHGKSTTYQDIRAWGNGADTNTRSCTGVNGGTRTGTKSRSGGVVTNNQHVHFERRNAVREIELTYGLGFARNLVRELVKH